jgi:hypothetical protein
VPTSQQVVQQQLDQVFVRTQGLQQQLASQAVASQPFLPHGPLPLAIRTHGLQSDLRRQQAERARRMAALSSQLPQPLVLAVGPAQPPQPQQPPVTVTGPVPGGSRLFSMPAPHIPGSPSQSAGVRRSIFTPSPLSSSPAQSPASSTSTLAVRLPASPLSDQCNITSPDMFDETL